MKKSIGLKFVVCLFVVSVLISGVAGAAEPKGISFVNETVFEKDSGERISIAINDADIRDILSLFASKLGVNIVYVGPTFRASFSVDNIDATLAFEIFLKSSSFDGGGLSFIRRDDLLIVGPASFLSNNFTDMLVMAKFNLNYMNAAELERYIRTLNVKVTILSLSTNQVIIQGLPYEISKVNEIIFHLDRQEFYKVEQGVLKPTIDLVRYNFRYISADTARNILNQVGVGGKTILLPTNQKSLWVSATPMDHVNIADIIRKVDIADNVAENDFAIYRPKYVKIDAINKAMNDLGLWHVAQGESGSTIRYIPSTLLSQNPYTILVNFKHIDRDIFEYIIEYIDTPSNMPENPTVFIYKFTNITSQTAKSRIDLLKDKMAFDSRLVEFIEFSYSGLHYQMFVVSPKSQEQAVRAFLKEIDVKTDIHKIVVDRSSEQHTLIARIPVISYLSGVPEKNFFTTNNVSPDPGGKLYLTILEDTLENVDKVLSVIHMMDNEKDRSVQIEAP